jgi:hypothetical protein
MTPARIQNELGTWLWWLRAAHVVVRHGDEVEDIEAIGPTATVDPRPMIEGPWWGENLRGSGTWNTKSPGVRLRIG